MDITLHLDSAAALFYTRIAAASGKSVQQVMQDALFLLAGELSLEALKAAADGPGSKTQL